MRWGAELMLAPFPAPLLAARLAFLDPLATPQTNFAQNPPCAMLRALRPLHL
jgi:hypothetical protein